MIFLGQDRSVAEINRILGRGKVTKSFQGMKANEIVEEIFEMVAKSPLDIKDRDVVEWVREAIVSRGINIPAKSIKSIKSYKATGDIDYFDKVAGTFIDRFYAVYGEGSEPDFVDGEFVGRFDGIYQGLIFEGIEREMEEYEWAELEGEFKGSFHDLASEDNSFFLGEFVGRDLKHYGYVIRVRGFFEGRFYDDGYSSL